MKLRIFFVCILALIVIPLSVSARSYPIIWSPERVNQTLGLGDTATVDVTFTSSEDLGPVELWIVPELEPFLTLSQNSFSVFQGGSYSLQLTCSIPFDIQTGLYDGTIHVRSDSATIPATLKVEIDVYDAVGVIGPEGGVVEVTDPESVIYGAKIDIKEDVLPVKNWFYISKCEVPHNLPASMKSAGECIDFGPTGFNFNDQILLSIPYNDYDNDGVVDGTTTLEQDITVLYFNPTSSKWEYSEIVDFNFDVNTVRIRTNHFSQYIPTTEIIAEVIIYVKDCKGNTVSAELVILEITSDDGVDVTHRAEPTEVSGKYHVKFIVDSPDLPIGEIGDLCYEWTNSWLWSATCTALKGIPPNMDYINCPILTGTLVGLFPELIPFSIKLNVGCLAAVGVARKGCAVSDSPANENPVTLMCDAFDATIEGVESLFGKNIYMQPIASVPGGGISFGAGQQVIVSGPSPSFPDLSIDACHTINVTIDSPGEHDIFSVEDEILFLGSAENDRGFIIPTSNIEWHIDGYLAQKPGDSFKRTLSGGNHEITLRAFDELGNEGSASVSICVTERPDAKNDTATTDENNSVTINVLANDFDINQCSGFVLVPPRITGVVFDGRGKVTITPAGYFVVFDPNGDFNDLKIGETATESFIYTIEDGGFATVNVTITGTGESDTDNDGVPDDDDNCPDHPNPGQENFDGDSQGDACDSDDDNDGVPDKYDMCPGTPMGVNVNVKGCPADEQDTDGDGVPDDYDDFPDDPNEWQDSDGDGIGDNADTDDDGDNFDDIVDNCPNVPNPDQLDSDGDGHGDACDAFPEDPNEWEDTDGDGTGNNADPDDDNDGLDDIVDNCPLVPNPDQADFDGDGIGDACDRDPHGQGGEGNSWGDPHLVTFDRLAYDFQGVGEFTLVRSLDDSLEIQTRMKPWGNSRVVSINSAVSMNVAEDRVVFYVDRTPALYLNGIPTTLETEVTQLPHGGRIELNQGIYIVIWPDSSRVRVHLRGSYLNLRILLSATRQGGVEGLLGNFDGERGNELVTRDGVTIGTRPSFNEFYKQYGESWRISQTQSLFDYIDGNTTDTHTDRTFPGGFVTTVVLSDSVRQQAEQICRDAGVTDPVYLEACILDVGVTGDSSFAEFPASVEAPEDSIQVDGFLGHTMENPAKSCFEIQQFGVVDGDRKYWIELPSGIFEMHCNFSSDTGGWTRVGALDTSTCYCGNDSIGDLRVDPDASMGKIPDTDVQALMTSTPDSPMELMYFSRSDGRYVWHALESVTDFDTSNKHTSSPFYCINWHCDDGTIDSSACGSEGQGCPVTAHGIGGFTKKIYVDSNFSRHIRGMHVNGNMCGLPNYERTSIWIYVR